MTARTLRDACVVGLLALCSAALHPSVAQTGASGAQNSGAQTSNAQPAPAPDVKAPQVDTPKRVLFVGNSYLYYNDSLHNHVRRMAAAADPSLEKTLAYKSATIGGARLAHHAIDWLIEPGRIGVKEPFELVLLQDVSSAAFSDKEREQSAATIAEFSEKIRRQGGQVALYMTHAYVAPHKEAGAQQLPKIVEHYVQTGNRVRALVIPVALAFDEAYRRKPAIALHQDYDGSHPSLLGSYLAACVVYASVYDKPCSGNAYDYYGRVSREDAAFLQGVADETVKQFFGR